MAEDLYKQAKSRISVAKNYENIGDIEKAVTSYIQAAELFESSDDLGDLQKAYKIYQVILKLDSGNERAKESLEKIKIRALEIKAENSETVVAPPKAVESSSEDEPSSPAGNEETKLAPSEESSEEPKEAKLLVPTPWLNIGRTRLKAIWSAVTEPPEGLELRYDRLPIFEEHAVKQAAEERRKQEEIKEMKSRTAVASAFSSTSSFASGGGGSLGLGGGSR